MNYTLINRNLTDGYITTNIIIYTARNFSTQKNRNSKWFSRYLMPNTLFTVNYLVSKCAPSRKFMYSRSITHALIDHGLAIVPRVCFRGRSHCNCGGNGDEGGEIRGAVTRLIVCTRGLCALYSVCYICMYKCVCESRHERDISRTRRAAQMRPQFCRGKTWRGLYVCPLPLPIHPKSEK